MADRFQNTRETNYGRFFMKRITGLKFGIFFLLIFFSCLSAADFIQVHTGTPEYDFVARTFTSVLEPLYGNQSASLKKIADGTDRVCELFCEEGSPLGILVYKTSLVQECAIFGVRDACEIKTLFVVDAAKNSGKGTASRLLERVMTAAQRLAARHVIVTVSESRPESLHFFLKKGFQVIHTFHGKYFPGVDEYLLARQA